MKSVVLGVDAREVFVVSVVDEIESSELGFEGSGRVRAEEDSGGR